MKKRVLVAMSGGVDSSVAALLLKEQGYDIEGVTLDMRLEGDASYLQRQENEKAIRDARTVCDILGIRHRIFSCAETFEKNVISYFVDEYRQGRTPNPCVVCNRTIKFGIVCDEARTQGFDFLATGHYAGKGVFEGAACIRRPADRKKDQTYFLYGIPQEILPFVLFPLEDVTKEDVYALAQKHRLPVVEKKQSQDICFIPQGDYAAFLNERLGGAVPGDIVNVRGEVLGKHKGIPYYTVGQRSGLGISAPKPLYVLCVDAARNRIVVGERAVLRARGLRAERVNLFVRDIPMDICAQIRYAHRPARCGMTVQGGSLTVEFEEPQEAVTPGQSVVVYHEEYIIGGGCIKEVFS